MTEYITIALNLKQINNAKDMKKRLGDITILSPYVFDDFETAPIPFSSATLHHDIFWRLPYATSKSANSFVFISSDLQNIDFDFVKSLRDDRPFFFADGNVRYTFGTQHSYKLFKMNKDSLCYFVFKSFENIHKQSLLHTGLMYAPERTSISDTTQAIFSHIGITNDHLYSQLGDVCHL